MRPTAIRFIGIVLPMFGILAAQEARPAGQFQAKFDMGGWSILNYALYHAEDRTPICAWDTLRTSARGR